MTFSDRKVRDLLRREFHCAWTNTDGEASAGASFAHEPGEPAGSCIRGNGEHNNLPDLVQVEAEPEHEPGLQA